MEITYTPVTFGTPVTINGTLTTNNARLSAYASIASDPFNAVSRTVPYDTIWYQNGTDFTLAGGVLTVNKSMIAMVCYNVSIDFTNGVDRTSTRVELKQTDLLGTGFTTVPGATMFTYNRTVEEAEGSASVSIILPLGAGYQLFVEATKERASVSTLQTRANACTAQ